MTTPTPAHPGAPDALRVTTLDGKYTVILTASGHLHAERYGQPWRECVGDGLILTLAQDIETLKGRLSAPRPEGPPEGEVTKVCHCGSEMGKGVCLDGASVQCKEMVCFDPPEPAKPEPPATGATPETDLNIMVRTRGGFFPGEVLRYIKPDFARSLETRLHAAEAEVRRLELQLAVKDGPAPLGFVSEAWIEERKKLAAQLQTALAAQQKAEGEAAKYTRLYLEEEKMRRNANCRNDELRATIARLTEEKARIIQDVNNLERGQRELSTQLAAEKSRADAARAAMQGERK